MECISLMTEHIMTLNSNAPGVFDRIIMVSMDELQDRQALVFPFIHLSMLSNNFFSEIIWWIVTKFHIESPWLVKIKWPACL